MTEALFDQYGHPVNVLVDPDHPEKLFDEYGRPVIVVKDASGLDLAAYNAIHVLATRGVYVPFLHYSLMGTTKVGTGNGNARFNGYLVRTGVTANSSCIAFECPTVSLGLSWSKFNFNLTTILKFQIVRLTSDSEAIAYIQFKNSSWDPVLQDMAGIGFGIKIANLALYGESYGTERGEVDLNTELVHQQSVEMEIIHIPGTSIEWKVNGVSLGVQDAGSKIPSGITPDVIFLCFAIQNGVTGGTETMMIVSNFSIWQSKA